MEKVTVVTVLVFLLVFGVIGWVLSIVNLVQCDFATPYKCEAINGVGVFVPPLGAIVGWLDIVD